MENPTFVVGHVNPDTDSIAAAMGYAWLLRERDGINAIAARAGAINLQTTWILKTLEMDAPVLLGDASPRFDSVMRRLDTTYPGKPLSEAWNIASKTGGIAPLIHPDGTPYGIITGRSLFEFVNRQVGPSPKQREIRLSEILDLPCELAADTHIPKVHQNTRIRDLLNRLLREEADEFWVVDDLGHYIGICRQRDLLNPPRLKVILVDHNEAQQSIASLDEAELIEILDHHRLGNPSTHVPIRFTVDIVGSTSTLVSERIEEIGLSAPPGIAGLLLAGLLADTLILNSPTTTGRDTIAAERLARWAFVGIGKLHNETIQSFGNKVLAAGAGIEAREPKDVVSSDLKNYQAGGLNFSISQAEVSNLYEISEQLGVLIWALAEMREMRGFDFAMLMVTDVVRGSSRLIINNLPVILENLPYTPLPDGTFLAEGVVSRKKQLLPVVLGLLEV